MTPDFTTFQPLLNDFWPWTDQALLLHATVPMLPSGWQAHHLLLSSDLPLLFYHQGHLLWETLSGSTDPYASLTHLYSSLLFPYIRKTPY